MGDFGADTQLGRLLVGEARSSTRRVLLLALVYFLVIAGLNLIISSYPAAEIPWVLDGFRHAFVISITFSKLVVFGPGVVVIAGLAALVAYLNKGYISSLILATAPVYSNYAFTLPGPVLMIRINEGLVFAPYWAALHVLPTALVYGTAGFLVGLGLRYLYQEFILTPNSEARGQI
jgi:hypothetical protein